MSILMSDFDWQQFSIKCPWLRSTPRGMLCAAAMKEEPDGVTMELCAKLNCAPLFWAEHFDQIKGD